MAEKDQWTNKGVDLTEETLAWAMLEIRRFGRVVGLRVRLPSVPAEPRDSHDEWKQENG